MLYPVTLSFRLSQREPTLVNRGKDLRRPATPGERKPDALLSPWTAAEMTVFSAVVGSLASRTLWTSRPAFAHSRTPFSTRMRIGASVQFKAASATTNGSCLPRRWGLQGRHSVVPASAVRRTPPPTRPDVQSPPEAPQAVQRSVSLQVPRSASGGRYPSTPPHAAPSHGALRLVQRRGTNSLETRRKKPRETADFEA